MKAYLTLTLLILQTISVAIAQNITSAAIEQVLVKAGKNRTELDKVIQHYSLTQHDSLKLKAACFLIANMDIHQSADYYWADSTGKRIPFNEMDYPDFVSAVKAFEEIKPQYGKISPVAFTYRDIDTIKADFLIDNIERAFTVWQQKSAISFEDFCNDILPYRVAAEPLQNWRKTYQEKFSNLKDSACLKSTEDMLHIFAGNFRSWFVNTWDLEQRKEPLPRLGPIQLLTRKKGNCDDIGDLMVYMLRSQGYPAHLEHIPYWATSTGRHYFNSTFGTAGQLVPFDVSTANVKIDNFSREPSKVIRITYAKQPDALGSLVTEENIPPGFMRMKNYKDVTTSYWRTESPELELFAAKANPSLAFVCVFNGLKWQPTWWGKIKNGKASFSDLSKGAVYMPMYYINEKLVPAGYPLALGYNNKAILKPNTEETRDIQIKEQDKYLKFRPDKRYKLFYWNNKWIQLGEQTATAESTELVFTKVPKNALLLLLPEYSQGKERPFMITDSGERIWW